MQIAGIGWYGTATELNESTVDSVVGALAITASSVVDQSIESRQINAWRESVGWLRETAARLIEYEPRASAWGFALEFEIPRRGYTIDAVCFANGVVIPIEFKSWAVDSSSIRQVEDYGLELSDFHKGSHLSPITPVLCSGGAGDDMKATLGDPESLVEAVTITPPNRLANTVIEVFKRNCHRVTGRQSFGEWLESPYEPTPTIIEAATALYAGHTIEDLTKSEASRKDISATENAIRSAIESARADNRKVICFVTGVPGAGKTLAGLNVVNKIPDAKATYLSGNGPLVKILREALAIDQHAREGTTKSEARRRSSTFVTNVHRWLDLYIDRKPNEAPLELVTVFDEAQRAWSRDHSRRKFNRDASEPEMMLTAMDRHPGWAAIVALVGGGQEINTGEAGLSEWGHALNADFRHWRVAVSPDLLSGERTSAGSMLFESVPDDLNTRLTVDPDLHLSVSQRSFRTTQLNSWVEAVLSDQPAYAAEIAERLDNYPMAVTRDLGLARAWLRQHSRGLRRAGLVASSGARRLRPHGINVRDSLDEADWFLRDKSDVRSSDFLELAATEFAIQGLELDWIGLCWGGDFRRTSDDWDVKRFVGTNWQDVKNADVRDFVRNRYRVLLTRAREGLVVWVPPGSPEDPTRTPEIYDGVYDYLVSSGMQELA